MEIDQSAPLKAKKEIDISVPIEKVWNLLTTIDDWPSWQPDVTSAKIEGELAAGTNFKWKAKAVNITSTIREFENWSCIGWTGNSIGMKAIHHWTMEPQGGLTHVITEESLSGWFPALLKVFDPNFLDKSLIRSLQVLKLESEKNSGEPDELSSN
jgi:uncharacterized protein YndB with AHSA1/START domain